MTGPILDGMDAILDSVTIERAEAERSDLLERPAAVSDPAASRRIGIVIGGVRFIADLSGALWHESERTLLVADLHLEKASRYAVRGQFLPPYDTAETLSRLSCLVARYAPRRLICLGDSFHDVKALERMGASDFETITALARSVEIVWISGNHDPQMPAHLPGHRADRLVIDGIQLRHEPSPQEFAEAEICGHLHPAARVATRYGTIRRRCFAGTERRLVMPAFGTLAGGLNIRENAFSRVFGTETPLAYVIGRNGVYPVGSRSLARD